MFLKGRGLTLFTTFYNHKTLDLEMNYCKIVFPHVIHLIYNIIILLFQRFDMDMNILFCRIIVKYIEQTKIYDIQTALFKFNAKHEDVSQTLDKSYVFRIRGKK